EDEGRLASSKEVADPGRGGGRGRGGRSGGAVACVAVVLVDGCRNGVLHRDTQYHGEQTMKRWRGAMVALCLLAPPARAQFTLYQISCVAGQPVGALFSFGSMYPNQAEPQTFCLLNTTASTQTVALLSVNGEGFSINAAAPMSVKAGASVNFTITFQGAMVASYSAWLDITGVPQVLLTASVVPALTYEVQ